MPINLKEIDRMIDDLKSKDLDFIFSQGIYIPSLGRKYTMQQLQEWVDKRVKFLESAKTLTEDKFVDYTNSIYSNLSVKEKDQSDDILADRSVTQTEEEWEKTVLIRLYKNVTK